MKRNGIILIAAAVIAFAGQAFAGFPVTASSPQASGGTIDGSSPFTIDIYMNNNGTADVTGFGFSVGFTSPDGSIANITHVDVGGDAEMPSVQYLNSFSSYFAFIMHVGSATFLDGTLPDYVNFTTAGTAGMPPGLGSRAYIRFNIQVDYSTTGTTGQLCVDSIGATETGGGTDWDWLFTPEEAPVTFNGTSGAICWTITNLTHSDVQQISDNDLPLPTDFNLGQNYPNPFNPSTTFDFALPERAQVNISIYNVLGQKVKTLADAEYQAGRYSVDWNGTADDGSSSATGIYFYRMNANDFQATKKLMLLK
jgi:hypothetical protein